MLTAEQEERRAYGVGGSDIPVILGLLEKYGKTRDGLLQVKAGKIQAEEPPEELMYWGNVMEKPIIQRLKTVKGWSVKQSDTLFYTGNLVLLCHPDGIIRKCTGKVGPGMLEIKNSKFMGKDGPADYHQAQLIWNIGIAGYTWGALAILVGGCELKVFEYDADPLLFAHMVTKATAFWNEVEQLKEAA